MMYKVLLIDDEPWILKDMELIIDWEEFGFKVIGKISDSEQALYLIKKQQPDLIICDIKMPGLNGIELMKMVKERFKDIFVVFLSAYSEFGYARQAIELGAFDYILKPTDESDLTNVLQRIHGRLAEKEEQQNKLKRYKNSELFLELIEDRLASSTIKRKLSSLGYELPYQNFMVAIVDFIKNNNPGNWQEDFRGCFPGCKLIYIQLGEHKWAVLYNCKEIRSELVQLWFSDLKKVARKEDILIGVSNDFDDLTLLKHYYRQAELMSYSSFIYKKSGIFLYSQYNNNYKELSRAIKRLTSPDKFKKMITELPGLLVNKKINLEEIAYLYNQLREKALALFSLDSELELLDPVDIVYSFNNLEELFTQLADFIVQEDNSYSEVSHDIVGSILEEIEGSYAKDLRLQDLADKYHLNYNYLSQLFKKETGQTFTNYLVELRIKKAIKLFAEDLLFYEIARKVGYNDYYHFCKIFKKHRGINPSEFKKIYID